MLLGDFALEPLEYFNVIFIRCYFADFVDIKRVYSAVIFSSNSNKSYRLNVVECENKYIFFVKICSLCLILPKQVTYALQHRLFQSATCRHISFYMQWHLHGYAHTIHHCFCKCTVVYAIFKCCLSVFPLG